MEPGPIPWRDIIDYGRREGLEEQEIDVLVVIIMAMDKAWREWNRDQPDGGGK